MIGTILLAVLNYIMPLVAATFLYHIYTNYIHPPSYLPPDTSRVVLITGCDSGFGEKLAIRLTQKGYTVLAACFNQKSIESLQSKVTRNKENLRGFQLDVTNADSVKQAAEFIKQNTRNTDYGLAALVNNSGIGVSGLVDWVNMEQVRACMEVNFFGVVAMTKMALPFLMRYKDVNGKRGRVINVASVAGWLGAPNMSAYCASKFAVEGFTDAFRREMWQWNMPIVLLEPGYMKTAILQGLGFSSDVAGTSEDKNWAAVPEPAKKRWGDSFRKQQVQALAKGLMAYAEDPQLVVDAMEDAVSNTNPPVRYMVGKWPNYLFRWVQYVPAYLSDLMIEFIDTPKSTPAGLQDPSLIQAE